MSLLFVPSRTREEIRKKKMDALEDQWKRKKQDLALSTFLRSCLEPQVEAGRPRDTEEPTEQLDCQLENFSVWEDILGVKTYLEHN